MMMTELRFLLKIFSAPQAQQSQLMRSRDDHSGVVS
jgi:hypothetical protein